MRATLQRKAKEMRSGFDIKIKGFLEVDFADFEKVQAASKAMDDLKKSLTKAGVEFEETKMEPARRRDAGELELTEKVEPEAAD